MAPKTIIALAAGNIIAAQMVSAMAITNVAAMGAMHGFCVSMTSGAINGKIDVKNVALDTVIGAITAQVGDKLGPTDTMVGMDRITAQVQTAFVNSTISSGLHGENPLKAGFMSAITTAVASFATNELPLGDIKHGNINYSENLRGMIHGAVSSGVRAGILGDNVLNAMGSGAVNNLINQLAESVFEDTKKQMDAKRTGKKLDLTDEKLNKLLEKEDVTVKRLEDMADRGYTLDEIKQLTDAPGMFRKEVQYARGESSQPTGFIKGITREMRETLDNIELSISNRQPSVLVDSDLHKPFKVEPDTTSKDLGGLEESLNYSDGIGDGINLPTNNDSEPKILFDIRQNTSNPTPRKTGQNPIEEPSLLSLVGNKMMGFFNAINPVGAVYADEIPKEIVEQAKLWQDIETQWATSQQNSNFSCTKYSNAEVICMGTNENGQILSLGRREFDGHVQYGKRLTQVGLSGELGNQVETITLNTKTGHVDYKTKKSEVQLSPYQLEQQFGQKYVVHEQNNKTQIVKPFVGPTRPEEQPGLINVLWSKGIMGTPQEKNEVWQAVGQGLIEGVNIGPNPNDGAFLKQSKVVARASRNVRDGFVHLATNPYGVISETLHSTALLGEDVLVGSWDKLTGSYHANHQNRLQQRWNTTQTILNDPLARDEAIATMMLGGGFGGSMPGTSLVQLSSKALDLSKQGVILGKKLSSSLQSPITFDGSTFMGGLRGSGTLGSTGGNIGQSFYNSIDFRSITKPKTSGLGSVSSYGEMNWSGMTYNHQGSFGSSVKLGSEYQYNPNKLTFNYQSTTPTQTGQLFDIRNSSNPTQRTFGKSQNNTYLEEISGIKSSISGTMPHRGMGNWLEPTIKLDGFMPLYNSGLGGKGLSTFVNAESSYFSTGPNINTNGLGRWLSETEKVKVRGLIEQGIPPRASIRYTKNEQLVPRDFGISSISANPEAHLLWENTISKIGTSKRGNVYTRLLDDIGSNNLPTKRVDLNKRYGLAFDYVSQKYRNAAKEQGIFAGDAIHHWNYNKVDFNSHVFHPENLFPTTCEQHWAIHELTRSGQIYKTPILELHELELIAWTPLATIPRNK